MARLVAKVQVMPGRKQFYKSCRDNMPCVSTNELYIGYRSARRLLEVEVSLGKRGSSWNF
jgi:hypothetical protein